MGTGTQAEVRTLRMPHNRRVTYRFSTGLGPTFVLVHGAGSSMDCWDAVRDLLVEAGRAVLTVDLPGHGMSSAEPGSYHPLDLTHALVSVVEHEELSQVHLVGHSLGGGLAVGLDVRLRERVLTVTLVSAGGLGKETSLPLRAATLPGADMALGLAFSPASLASLRWLGRAMSALGMRHPLGETGLGSLAWLGHTRQRAAFLATIRHVVGPRGQRMSALSHLATQDGRRFLFVWGSRDPIIPLRHGVRAQGIVEGSRLHVFHGAGHEPHTHDPERFVSVLLEHACQGESLCRA